MALAVIDTSHNDCKVFAVAEPTQHESSIILSSHNGGVDDVTVSSHNNLPSYVTVRRTGR